ncbi:Calponin like (CH) domain [Trypanosoma vivax]|uniref:Calponin-homology (CH) domain-containing protein n=1 Tax=Trypanosoma vivax (strain Y486) TaxID=1055687 RepID=G0UD04_TRYVY|nr:hypothetical protein TRVL_04873 [Trypanosoma vivax]KAH8607983.1 Calponin like (CH) domain [Trypanosoma vivax]CCC53714.1 conserved hypothetical protein [Trypanosoma vivax Y486]
MSLSVFTRIDEDDLRGLYRRFDPDKEAQVGDIVRECVENGIQPRAFFDELYKTHGISHFPHRDDMISFLRSAVPQATLTHVESALRDCEVREQLTKTEALKALRSRVAHISEPDEKKEDSDEKEHHDVSDFAEKGDDEILGATLKRLNVSVTRDAKNQMMADECRQWVAAVVGDAYNTEVLQMDNFIDALRNGVVLLVLLQKLRNPPVPDSELNVPKRTTGFFARDNVHRFLKQAATMYNLAESELFTDSDLCDGKDDRAVITCLLSIARIAYARGWVDVAPSTVVNELEASVKMKQIAVQEEREEAVEGKEEMEEEERIQEKGEEEEQEEELLISTPKIVDRLDEELYAVGCETKSEEGLLKSVKESSSPVGGRVSIEVTEGVLNGIPTAENGNGCDGDDEACGVQVEVVSGRSCTKLRKSDQRKRKKICSTPVSLVRERSKSTSITLAKPSVQRQEAMAVSIEKPVQETSRAPVYRPRRWDKIDILLSAVVNAYFDVHRFSSIRLRRLSGRMGQYMAYHLSKERKQMLHVNIVQGKVMAHTVINGMSTETAEWYELRVWLEWYERSA